MSFCAEGVLDGNLDINSAIRQSVVVFSIIKSKLGRYFYTDILLRVKTQKKYVTENY